MESQAKKNGAPIASAVAVISSKLFRSIRHLRCHGRFRQNRQTLGLASCPSYFDFFEEQRRRYHRGGQSIPLRRSKRPESGSGNPVDLALHIVVNEFIVTDACDVSQHTRA